MKSGGTNDDTWTGIVMCADGGETQAGCHGNEVFTEYVRSRDVPIPKFQLIPIPEL